MTQFVGRHGYWVLNDAGEPRPARDLAELHAFMAEGDGARTVLRQTDFSWTPAAVEVSTIFLPIGFHDDRWESIIFSRAGDERAGVLDGPFRYRTRAEAEAGHRALCSWVMDELLLAQRQLKPSWP